MCAFQIDVKLRKNILLKDKKLEGQKKQQADQKSKEIDCLFKRIKQLQKLNEETAKTNLESDTDNILILIIILWPLTTLFSHLPNPQENPERLHLTTLFPKFLVNICQSMAIVIVIN